MLPDFGIYWWDLGARVYRRHSASSFEAINIPQNNWRSRAEQNTSSGDHQPTQPEFSGVQQKAADIDYEDEDDDPDLTQTPGRLLLY